ncbi:transporter substrate-binding domain-containing protein [Roseateles asaccharophilus]|uniref:Polar amino acid transport system substrate-binding protein n=1 Tax=Roseateles asaccharophilus TaxID=582607 RepID=A0ABU2ADS0_9BURK|nr:transporter substrate-binding domain-containing protein [Roseateles asaccharophilus]MDR7335351.1 polar amino acid transport system substrate-binding protein [Roseateles asaccharophilus]
MAIWRCTLAALGLWLSAQSCAADGCGPYRVGLREYPRLYQRAAAGQFGGLDKDFFDALAERSGCKLEFQLESQPRLWMRLARGDIDMASWVVPSEQRATVVRILPIMGGRMMAVTWRDAGIKSEAEFLADPALRAVAISQALYGPGYDPLLAQLRTQGRVSDVADFDIAWRAFAGRRVALMLAYPWSLAGQPPELMAQLQLSDWHAAETATTSGLALSRKTVREADAHKLEQALRAMRLDGSLAQLLARHLPAGTVRLLPP